MSTLYSEIEDFFKNKPETKTFYYNNQPYTYISHNCQGLDNRCFINVGDTELFINNIKQIQFTPTTTTTTKSPEQIKAENIANLQLRLAGVKRGGYQAKYLKYKQKYLQLKQLL